MLPPTEALHGEFVLPEGATFGESATTAVERLAFRVGPISLLCATDVGREVVLPPMVSRLPHLPDWFSGVANVRGLLVPVVDLAAALTVEHDHDARPYLLICGSGNNTIGLLVDGLPLPRKFEPADLMSGVPPHPVLLDGHVYRGYERDGMVWLDLDAEGFFSTLAERIAA
jgi:purine-binding chemotaxis protein CheW